MFTPRRLRHLHRSLVPIMAMPLLVTVTTGIGFQMAVVSGRASDFSWLLALHRGQFGRINLEMVYPFLNGLGLLTLLVTGLVMWWQMPRRSSQRSS